MSSYDDYTVDKLRDTCRLRGLNKKVKGFWKLRKSELIKLLKKYPSKTTNVILRNQKSDLNKLGARKSKSKK